MADAKRTCSTPGCERPVRCRGLCGAHYQTAMSTGRLPKVLKRDSTDVERITVTCPCGTEMRLTPAKAQRKRYCSTACKYRYRIRPRGLKYNVVTDNPTRFAPGFTPWNLGMTGELAVNWKGDDVGYCGLHSWVRKTLSKTGKCQNCGTTAKPTEWSNISHEYRRSEDDWQELCHLCHMRYDRENGWGVVARRFA